MLIDQSIDVTVDRCLCLRRSIDRLIHRRIQTPTHPRHQGDLTDVEATLKAGKGVLDGLAGAEESIVYSSYYKAASEYHKVGSVRG